MKKIGIIFAIDEELEAMKEKIIITKEYNIFELTFYEGTINSIIFILVKCGVGKVNAARTTQILIDNINPDYIFNIGVAGSLVDSLNIGDIVIGESLVQHDFDLTAFKREKGYIPNIGKYIYSSKELVDLAVSIINNINNINSLVGVIATGDIFCTDKIVAKEINKEFKALCIEMEGAAIAQVCYLNKIPFLIIRSISDTPNNNNVITYEEFLISSSNNIATSMKEILLSLGDV